MKKILLPLLVVVSTLIVIICLKFNNKTSTLDVSSLEDKELTSYNITEEGKYTITESTDEIIYVNVSGTVNLILDNVSIKGIVITSGKVLITINGDNTLYNDSLSTYDAVIYSEDDLYFDGEGSLNITSNMNGIHSKGNINIESGSFNINSYLDGIFSKKVLTINDGVFSINSTSKTISDTESSKGLKGSEGITINNGEFNINTIDDSIHSNKDIVIKDGTFTISSSDDGIHSDDSLTIEDGIITISKCYEGLEANYIYINGGTINITSSDDGINATSGESTSMFESDGSIIKITKGVVTIDASGDGIDSNGDVVMTGGEVTVYGPVNDGNGALDKNGEFTITGGVLLAGGMSGMAEMPSGKQNSVMINFNSYISDTIYIKKDNEVVLEYSSTKKFNNLVLSSNLLEDNETYEVYIGSTFYTDFTITSSTLKVGNSTNRNFR